MTVKTVFIQEYIDQCENCKLTKDKQIMVKLCANSICSSPITNNSIKSGQNLFIDVGLFDQILLFNYSIQNLQLFSNGLDITNTTTKTALTDSTSSSLQLGFSITGAGVYNFELRVLLNSRPVVLDANGNIVYDTKDFFSKLRMTKPQTSR